MSFVEQFRETGCLTLTRLFDPELIEAIGEQVMGQFSGPLDQLPPHLNVGHRRAQLPVTLEGRLLDQTLYAHPLLLRMLSALIGGDMVIDNITCVVAFPGAEDQDFHRDHPDLFPEWPTTSASIPPFSITVAIPLVDLTPETGTTKLYPGSALLSQDEAQRTLPTAPAELPYIERGGCFLMDYRLWHQGTANRSANPRPVLYLVYARPWFTDIANFRKHARIMLARDDVARIAEEHRTLFRRLAAKGGFDQTERELLGRLPKRG